MRRSAPRFQYPYDMEEDWLGSRNNHRPIEEASMKKLINDEMSRRPKSQQNRPSIVARLMGIDVPTPETKLTLYPIKKREEASRTNPSVNEKNPRSPIIRSYSKLDYSEHEFNPIYDSTSSRPKRREHPQEEELQKFKKEFEAWQAAKFKQSSRFAELEDSPKWAMKERSVEKKSHDLVRARSAHRSHSRSCGEISEIYGAECKELNTFPCRSRYREKEHVPTTIVVLKPGPDRIWSSEDSYTSFSGSSEDKGSIEDFLEEVKERLRLEIQGKTLLHKGLIESGNRMPGPTVEKSLRIARQRSNRVDKSLTRELESGHGLIRSESMRSHRSDVRSPEFVTRDTRKFLAERLKNVLKRESDENVSIGVGHNFSSSSREIHLHVENYDRYFETEEGVDEKRVFQKEEEIVKSEEEHEEEMGTMSCRDESLSPKNLVRSLSAPVSGTSFGKLLLQDRHVITGAHIRRKHERSIDNLFAGMKKGKKEKERFSLKEKVYNFRSSFDLRRRLFGRRMSSMADLRTCEPSFMKDIMNGPTVILNPGERYENSTEVPPSPASVCSSTAQEEFWRPSNDLSPISSPGTPSRENVDRNHSCEEISSAQNELRMQPSLSDSDWAVEETTEPDQIEFKLPELEDGLAAYVRALLVASGLYKGLTIPCLSISDPLENPIPASVYEQVEESYKQQAKEESSSQGGIEANHKILYDLLNDALGNVTGPPVFSSRFGNKKTCDFLQRLIPGPRLMDAVWGFISSVLYRTEDDVLLDYSIDSMVARDIGLAPWLGLLDEQVDEVGAEMESSILGDLIGEITRDFKLR